MFGRKKQPEICIPVSLEETLTSDSCSKLVIELVKYILYQKQQIPFSYDTLAQLQTRFKPADKNSSSTKTLINSLRIISDNLVDQLNANNCEVREIVIIIGATSVSPKLCVRLELPDEILSSRRHMEYQHPSRKPLLNLMRSIIDCQEFQEAMTVPLGVTNTFVLLQKSDSNPTSDFFLPKPQYNPQTQTTTCFAIKFSKISSIPEKCSCKDVVDVYHDLPPGIAEKRVVDESQKKNQSNEIKKEFPLLWYQSREVIKGFKFSR